MFTIVRYKTIDILRRNDTIKSTVAKLFELDQSNNNPVDLDRIIDGGRLMAKLSHEQREVVTLTKYLGMTTNEAAQLIGIKEYTVKAQLRRGLKNLHKQWQHGGGMMTEREQFINSLVEDMQAVEYTHVCRSAMVWLMSAFAFAAMLAYLTGPYRSGITT